METAVLRKLFGDLGDYWAHIDDKNSDKQITKTEKLEDHISLTLLYFRRLWQEKGIDEICDRFCMKMCSGITIEMKAFLRNAIEGIAVFHDAGKINPEYQRRRLGNRLIPDRGDLFHVGCQHSLLSAVLYLDYFRDELRKAEGSKEDKEFVRELLVYHAYIISRHHSDLNRFTEFISVLENGSGKEIMEVFQQNKTIYRKTFSLNEAKVRDIRKKIEKREAVDPSMEQSAFRYAYVKLLYSLLVASDYYAVAQFSHGKPVTGSGDLENIEEWVKIYENTDRMKQIRKYQEEFYPLTEEQLKSEKRIDVLRTELFLEAEQEWEKNKGANLFYLEAPTGSGKSNTAMNLSFQMIAGDPRLKKIYYIYPFNTLVEQNVENISKVFEDAPEVLNRIAVVNSLTPIKMDVIEKRKEEEDENPIFYQKALLDRQFLNYPMILSTHVTLFETLFGDTKESAFGFHQMANSVVVLDEIQSYKNTLWGEIILFLKSFAYLLNMKILIMSATLPDLDLLSAQAVPAVKLIRKREKYFSHPSFRDRVKISYELMDVENILEILQTCLQSLSREKKKIMVEFIKKGSARLFYEQLVKDEKITCEVEYLSGDDSRMERTRILEKVKKSEEGIILVATQVVEAGIDIDMDIGFKNISKLDSEEQFMGRINRSCLKSGKVYFFRLDNAKRIYDKDIRVEKEYTLDNAEMREILVHKNYGKYYSLILSILKLNYNDQIGEQGLRDFFQQVGKLDYPAVEKRMRLIEEDYRTMTVYLARVLRDERNKEHIDGRQIWTEYGVLLNNFSMPYSEKIVKLSVVKSKMNHFIYQIEWNPDLIYDDKIGDIFYIEDGEKYFEDGKLNRTKLQGEGVSFI